MQPPVETGGYKDCAPTERIGIVSFTECMRFLDFSLGRAMFKQAAVEEDLNGKQERFFKNGNSENCELLC